MRIWSLHPMLLDNIGLVACWRESLLAQACLHDPTKGYSDHPQLSRFKNSSDPKGFIGLYLSNLYGDSLRRKMKFDPNKIRTAYFPLSRIRVTSGQVRYELDHLISKCTLRSINVATMLVDNYDLYCRTVNPIFEIVDDDKIEYWEKVKGG